ncbi:hypothetical protein HYW75_02040 [Candidatus Pacearchaeota archaeon]|nr:hypothetical protein [Candidatus Pacearchaeota archaeon]
MKKLGNDRQGIEGFEFRVGGLYILLGIFRFSMPERYAQEAEHKFVVEAKNTLLSIYVAPGGHSYVAGRFELDRDRLVGGGSCYLDKEDNLILNDYSNNFGAIPKVVAQRFAELLIPEVNKLGLEVKAISVNQNEGKLNYYWKERGFN